MGVRRAVEMVLDAPEKHEKPIYTFGPLIHNPQVLELLERKGICVLEKIPEKGKGTVMIRAHGVPPGAGEALKKAGFRVIDATCPRVIKVQTIIARHAAKGNEVIIIGDRDHPEVIGLLGYAGGRGHVAGTLDELSALPGYEHAIIVAQTTQSTAFFREVTNWVHIHHPHYNIFNTICDSTDKRQAEVKEIARSVDAIIVVGGKNSGNTRRLAQIGEETGKPTFHIETEEELDPAAFTHARTVAVTAGASTPNWIIRKIIRFLEAMPIQRGGPWIRTLYYVQKLLLLTNLYLALGAGSLCFACLTLQGIRPYAPYTLVAMVYVLSMHILNNLTGLESDYYNEPDRARFYTRFKLPLAVFALVSGGLGLLTALAMGWAPFAALFVMSILGLSYNLVLIPEKGIPGRGKHPLQEDREITPETKAFRYRRIRDIPGSKTILIAFAWGVVTALFPRLSVSMEGVSQTAVTFIWATSMVFSRSAFFDILDMQGDQIVGKETFPILIGEKRMLKGIKTLLLFIFLLMLYSANAAWIPAAGYVLSLIPLIMAGIIFLHEKGIMIPGLRLEFVIESQFVLCGLIAFLFNLFNG